jgi:hypothetical protein
MMIITAFPASKNVYLADIIIINALNANRATILGVEPNA